MKRTLMLLSLAVQLKAATIYVAKTGNDGNPGTIGSPKLTVQAAYNIANAGDTVLINDTGFYAESPRFDRPGTSANPIMINGGGATIRGWSHENIYNFVYGFGGVTNGTTTFNPRVYFSQGAHFNIISNNVIDPAGVTTGYPIFQWNGPASLGGVTGSSNIIISNIIRNIKDEMVFRLNGTSNLVTGNFIYNIDNTDYFQVAGWTNMIVNNVLSNLFLGGTYTNNHADIIQVFGDAGGTPQVSWGHLFESNRVITATEFAQLGNLTDDGLNNVGGLTIRNNYFQGISAKCSVAMPDVYFYNNVFYSCATNTNNGGAILIFSDSGSIGKGNRGRVLNNIFLDCGIGSQTNNNNGWYSFDTTLTNCYADYNYVGKYISGSYAAIDQNSNTNQYITNGGTWNKLLWFEPHGRNGGDPLIVNYSQQDFRLTSASPLRGAGLNLTNFTTDIRGVTRSVWDIGAWAYSASDFNNYPYYITPRLIQGYTTIASNATTINIPANIYRTAIEIARRSYTNNPNQWTVYTNLYTLSSASASNVITFMDTNFSGNAYEYRIKQTIPTNQISGDPNGYIDYQYLVTGHRIPLWETKGSVCLLVESNYNAASGSRIATLKSDLIGAGYKVYLHTNILVSEVTEGTPWTNAVWTTKQLIQTDYAINTNTRLYVLIVGHVPVPYSGITLAPGSHADSVGAFGTDWFYADLNGTFTDVGNTSATDGGVPALFTHNAVGDGKFDQDFIPSTPEVIVGRIDLGYSNFSAFSNTEKQRLDAYLDRNHAWRHKQFTVRDQAMIYNMGNTNLTVNDKPYEDNNRFVGMLGSSAKLTLGDWLPDSSTNNSFLYASEQGNGAVDQSYQLGTTANFYQTNFYGVFTASYGSYYGAWDSMNTNTFLKGILANNGYVLTTYYNENFNHLSSSAIDEPIGYETYAMTFQRFLITSGKEYTWYDRIVPFTGTFGVNDQTKMFAESLMGDPTLVTHQVYPASSPAVNISGSDNVVTWTASTDTGIVGYHIYRTLTSDLNSFARLTSSPQASSPYTDTGAASGGPYTYMVRAIKLNDTVNRSFYEASQGVFAESGGSSPTISPGTRITSPVTLRNSTRFQ